MKKISCSKGTIEQFRQAVEDRIDELSLTSATNTSNIAAKPAVECAEDEKYDADEYADMLEGGIEDELQDIMHDDNVIVEFRHSNYIPFTAIVTDADYGTVTFDFEENELGFTVDSLKDDIAYISETIRTFVETGEVPEA